MKILALVTEAFGGVGGIAQYNRDLLTALQEMEEVEATVVLPRYGEADPGLPRLEQHAPKNGRLSYALAALREARHLQADVIFCGHIFMLPLAMLVGSWMDKPVWLQIHGIDAWQKPSALIGRLVERVSLVFSVSRYTRSRFLQWATVSPERVRVLPNTVASRYQPGEREALRSKLDIQGHFVLLSVGRLAASESYKGQDRVIRCLGELRRQYPEILYLIAGSGDDQPRLERLVQDSGVSDVVRFLGQVSADQLVELYQAADLFVMPSTGEGFGIVFLEAMACGTPALGLDQDGSRDPLRDGALGHVASVQSLCADIAAALAQPRPEALSQRTLHYFGFDSFKIQVARLLRTWPVWQYRENT